MAADGIMSFGLRVSGWPEAVAKMPWPAPMQPQRGSWRARLPDEGGVRVVFDDSIVQDTTSEKRQDMDEVAAGLMDRAEYRAKWYGESEG